jgi:putative ABC transport system permease protein
MLDYIEDAMATMTILLAGIASISLLVWGIWIMNIMLVSVTERIKEIWIRKAIWAGGIDILMQFLTESSILSVIWWLIWIAFAYVVCNFVDYFWWETLPVAISSTSIILSFSVSLTIGLVFGITPARRAAQLRPIEALRFE